MLRIYYCDTSTLDADGSYLLSRYRRERLSKLSLLRQQKESIGAELMLNHALKSVDPHYLLPAEIDVGEKGKPSLPDGRIHFSISHSTGYAACAVSDVPVGIDIQHKEKFREKMAERYFHPAETACIRASDDADSAFTQIWCMKESFVKCRGTGLAGFMNSVNVLEIPGIYHWEEDGLHMAVCLEGLAQKPERIEKIQV